MYLPTLLVLTKSTGWALAMMRFVKPGMIWYVMVQVLSQMLHPKYATVHEKYAADRRRTADSAWEGQVSQRGPIEMSSDHTREVSMTSEPETPTPFQQYERSRFGLIAKTGDYAAACFESPV